MVRSAPAILDRKYDQMLLDPLLVNDTSGTQIPNINKVSMQGHNDSISQIQ